MNLTNTRAAKLSTYSYRTTKRLNLTAVIGRPRDHPPITEQIGMRRTNHNQEFCCRYHLLNDQRWFSQKHWNREIPLSGPGILGTRPSDMKLLQEAI